MAPLKKSVICSAPTLAYLERAQSFSYKVGFTIKDAVADIAEKLKVQERDLTTLSQWLYIFTKVGLPLPSNASVCQ